MGFKTGAIVNVWETKYRSDSMTTARISVSKKDLQTGEYVQDFSGYAAFLGSAVAEKALKLKPKSRIVLGDIDVVTNYDAEHKKSYTNFNIYSFKMADEVYAEQKAAKNAEPEEGSFQDDFSDGLPF